MMDTVEQIRSALQEGGMDLWMTAGSALVALGSFFFNWRMVQRQETRANAALKLAHDSDLIRWSDEVISVLAETHEMLVEKGMAYVDAEFRSRRLHKRAHLSALIDRGRLFFPNRTDGDAAGHGSDKEEAFRGRRQPAIDALVAAYDLLGRTGDTPGPELSVAADLMKLRRTFVAEVFKAVDPVRRGSTLKGLNP